MNGRVNEYSKAVQELFLPKQQQQDPAEASPIFFDFRLQESRTQSSVARLRSRILTQDPDCQAARDVLVLTGSCLRSALPQLEQALADNLPTSLVLVDDNNDIGLVIRIWGCKLLWSDLLSGQGSIHAERGCTQYLYHYLVPLRWLPDAELLLTKWKGWKEKPPTDSLRRFKAALRNAESGMISGADDDNKKVAAGRFGRLGAKERRAWHNFANPTLRGKASPNQEPVWEGCGMCVAWLAWLILERMMQHWS